MSDKADKKQVDQATLEAIKEWLVTQRGSMPPVVAAGLARILSFYQTLMVLQNSRLKMQTLLMQFLGLEPKSERGKGSPKTPRQGKKLTEEEKSARKEKLEQKRQADAAEVQRIYAESFNILATTLAKVDESTWKAPLTESAGSPKTDPSDARADARFVSEIANSHLADVVKPPKAEGSFARIRTEDLYAFLKCSTMAKAFSAGFGMNEAFPDPAGRSLQSDFHTRTIWDVEINFTRTDVSVETVTDRISGERRTAPVDLAPPNWRHSYSLIAFFVMMVVNFLIPMTRLSRMFRTPEKNFPVGTIFNMVRFAANCAEPVYHVLGKQLGQVGSLEGDDTNTKCHQMKKSKEVLEDEAKAKKKAAQSEEPEDPDPFAAERSLVDRVATYLGRFFAGTTVEEKSGIHLSMVTGCTNIDDERTRIIFYRTHRGTVGDLLGQLWSFDKKKRKIKFTCDLNAQNVPAERLRKHIDLTIGGCVAHLRRGFRAACKLEAASDDCRYLLQLFRRLYDMERMARDEGNTLELISWYRQRYGKILWKLIFEKIEEMSKKWLKNTGDLGDHIAYALKNRKAFMVYLDDPRMPIDNNFSERNLRPEKVHMANSRQHLTEDGRVAFDILLTMIRTCACAQVSPQDWLIWVMKNRDEVKQRPELYTPYQYRLLLQKP